jgi:23S rRNA (uridine2552-2'-O)-methyltransferase
MHKVKDYYFQKAKREGFVARSAYKLDEIDRKQRLIRPGLRVLDLGSAPGSWLQYVARRVGDRGSVVGIDLEPVTAALPANVRVIQGDVFEIGVEVLASEPHPTASDGPPPLPVHGEGKDANAGTAREESAGFDLILSDMAPNTTGIPSADALRSADLALRALELAQLALPDGTSLLKPGGALLVKVFEGARVPEIRATFRECFDEVSIEKPKASRSESVEVFLLGKGFRGPQPPLPEEKGSKLRHEPASPAKRST